MAFEAGKFIPSFLQRRRAIQQAGGSKFLVGPRLSIEAANKLGLVSAMGFPRQSVRRPELELFDQYYEGRQYQNLSPWDNFDPQADHVPVRKRRPRIQMAFAKTLAERVTSKLIGSETFPKITVEDDPDTEEYFRFIIKAAKLKTRLLEPTRRELTAGSVFIRFSIVDGTFKVEHFLTKFCFPTFADNGELESIEIRFVFGDPTDKDDKGNPKRKWFRMRLGQFIDVKFVSADFKESEELPDFENDPRFNRVEEEVEHGFGFVQGEWMRTMEMPDSPDGISLIGDILGFIDEMNYNLSQSSTAIQYNQDPQLVFKGMNQEEINELIRSSMKAWNLGREGEGTFLETTLMGAKHAMEFRDKVKLGIGDISRVIMMDPEKMVAHAQSAKALEVLHGPLVDLVTELRPMKGDAILSLTLKMGIANLMMIRRGQPAPVTVPPGFSPKSLDLGLSWPPIFAQTMQDLQTKVSLAVSASSANLISRETALKFVAKDFGVENVEEEQAKVNAQPVINPFGGF